MSATQEGKERARAYLLGFFESAKEECPQGFRFMVFLDKTTLRLHKALVKGFMDPRQVTNNRNFVYVGIYDSATPIERFKKDLVAAWKNKDSDEIDVIGTLEKLAGVQQ